MSKKKPKGLSDLQQRIRKTGLDTFCGRYGVINRRHNRYPNLVGLKYHQLEGKMGSAMVQTCRGLILDEDNDWEVVSYPFDKFFNYGEPHASKAFDWSSAIFQEKLDGSMITLYYYKGEWHVSTNGSPDASGQLPDIPGIENINRPATFAEYFWNTWRKINHLKDGWSLLPTTGYNYMFELTGPLNQVVVKHQTENLHLLGARDLKTYQEITVEEARALILGANIKPVRVFTIESVESAFERLKKMDGSLQEGYVIVDENFRRMKIKCDDYVRKHHMKGRGLTKKGLLKIVINNEIEEWITYFPEHKEILLKYKILLANLIHELQMDYFYAVRSIGATGTAKEFAYIANKSRIPSVLFNCWRKKTNSIKESLLSLQPEKILDIIIDKEM